MDRRRFQHICDVFQRLCEVPDDQRETLLDELATDDADLKERVRALLRRDERLDEEGSLHGVQQDLGQMAHQALESEAPTPPQEIGGYRVLGELGRGGMGVVYRAEQLQPRREVALKVIRPGFGSAMMVRRFEHEAELLGRLQHPGIAQIFAAGTFERDGEIQSFFVMELVEGLPLSQYARERGLSVQSRLELLVDLCDAVQHAHQKGIIHRDLKPGNILVTEHGQPKILDFGVARSMEADDRSTTLNTQAGQLLGTLPYMSPEQVHGDSLKIDTRSDVYSLGVIAYELLSGRLPVDLENLTTPQAIHAITEREPQRLGNVDPALRGDIETIVAKTLEKECPRRYQSAGELRADLLRSLRHQPIDARPPSTVYQLKKFARRHTGLMSGLMVAVAILIMAMVGMAMLTMRARHAESVAEDRAETATNAKLAAERARDEADRREKIARAVSQFLDRMLSAPDPWSERYAGDLDVRVVTVLDQAARELDSSFEGFTETEAALRSTLGRTYENLGYASKAVPQLERALELCRERLGPDASDTLEAMLALVGAYVAVGRIDEAEVLARDARERHHQVFGPDAIQSVNAAFALGEVLFQRRELTEALELAQETLRVCQKSLGTENQHTLRAMGNLSVIHLNREEIEEAVAYQEDVLEGYIPLFGEEHPDTLVVMSNLSGIYWKEGRRDEAEELARKVYNIRKEIFGEHHSSTLLALNSIIVFLNGRHQFGEAARLRARQIELAEENLGEEHPMTLMYKYNDVVYLFQRKRMDQAERLSKEVYEARVRVLSKSHEQTLESMKVHSEILTAQHRFDEAVVLLEETIDVAEEALSEEHWRTAWFKVELGGLLRRLDRPEEAEEYLLEGLEVLEGLPGQGTRVHAAKMRLLSLYKELGLTEEAEAIRAR